MALHLTLLDGRLHDRAGFTCGVPSLDTYLREQAGQHQRNGIATTHVLVDAAQPRHILGYCSLAAAQLNLSELQPADRKRLPTYPVPAVRMARLAVSAGAHGHRYGRLLVGHAANCASALRETLGVRVLLVDALDVKAARFYRAYGFREAMANSHTLYLPLGKLIAP
ncbi:GNAT family N-acetyltransferase [Thermomonas sp.]|uniref:GNAT family N-acetyltransferase n=1 Tax=Thermomonas sp. TaxID=1971895 RepID=UPI00262F5885|nr:GNAT family N-acetyltransferase [Thermomonas sp.]